MIVSPLSLTLSAVMVIGNGTSVKAAVPAGMVKTPVPAAQSAPVMV